MKLEMEIDIDKFRYGLVGDGYLYNEVANMSEEQLLTILKDRIRHRVQIEYIHSQPIVRDVLIQKGEYKMKAINIRWDIDEDYDEDLDILQMLPDEIEIPEGMIDEDEISDYISNVTGFCHNGYDLDF